MKLDFNNGKDKNKVNQLIEGDFEAMTKMRKKHLPDLQSEIQEALKDYRGESITIVLQKEDENGLPDHAHVLMIGVSRVECQIAMARALNRASLKTVDVIAESVKGNPKAMLKMMAAMMEEDFGLDKEEKE